MSKFGMSKLGKMSLIGLSLLTFGLGGCSTDTTDTSVAADSSQIERRIVFIDTWTDTYLLSITGLCSIKNGDGDGNTGGNSVAVTCKTGVNMYKKHYFTLNGSVTYFSEQLGNAQVGVYRYKVVFKPLAIIPPDVQLEIKAP